MTRFLRPLACAALLAAMAPAGISALEVPFLAGRVNDLAGLLPPEDHRRLEEKLAALEQATGAQMAVLTLPSLEGENLEDFSLKVAETWRLGREDHDDGVLLLIAVQERGMRLEVGYGLEEQIPDLVARRVLDDHLRPRFRAGDFPGGIEAGIDVVSARLLGEEEPPAPASLHDSPEVSTTEVVIMGLVFVAVVGVFSTIAVFGSGCGSWLIYFFLTPFWVTLPAIILGAPTGISLAAFWLLLVPLIKVLLHRSPAGKRFKERYPGLVRFAQATATSSGRSWSSSGGWSSGGGGFSGGGGSFGGGGASSSW